MLNDLFQTQNEVFSLSSFIINFLCGVFLSLLIRYHYTKFGSTITNRNDFANIFPFITLTTILIISVVKSSLALSLGLVGALSIVRFRTPIKEPEELAYLFLCIATGLGLGANQTIVTILAVILILVFLSILKKRMIVKNNKNMFLNIEFEDTKELKKDQIHDFIVTTVTKEFEGSDLRQVTTKNNYYHASFIIHFDEISKLQNIISVLEIKYPGISVSYIDQRQVPSL
tara:strand:- start:2143 stop:2829 length:687 start_codon:yes stop_codon:yes gene_type:complete